MNPSLAAHFFRHEYGRLVAMMVRRAGVQELEVVEDAVQAALLAAVETWPRSGVPESPAAWLHRVAQNELASELRRRARRGRQALALEPPPVEVAAPDAALGADVRDDLLRMLFVCCDESIPIEGQLVLALKTLCGFDVREIAERLFMTEANVYKRLSRARDRLREVEVRDAELSTADLATRLPAVRAIVYTLFTEGHLSSHADEALRRELCDEAVRLGALLADHPIAATPETFALLALMHLHRARMAARRDATGGLVLLEEQDRSSWDPEDIRNGIAWLARSATGSTFSRYHAEAGVAAEHCLAPSVSETRWDRVVECYELLDALAPSPVHTLNRAVAVAELRGPAVGLAVLDGLAPPSWLEGSHQWSAVLSDLHRRAGHGELAARHRAAALASAPSDAIRAALAKRLR